MSLCGHARGHPRAGPIPRRGPGQRAMLLGCSGHAATSVTNQYPARSSRRHRTACQPGRRPVAMGPTGRIAAKLDPDGARPSCRLASGQRLGGIHRQRHPAFGQPSPRAGIHALGQLCHQKRRIHRPATPSGADITPPFAIVRLSRIFGNHHFTRANDYLVQQGLKPIQW